MKQNIIRLKFNLKDPSGIVAPIGKIATYQADIADGVAVWWFNNEAITKRRAEMLIKSGDVNTVYLADIKKAITKLENKTKEEIRDLILQQVKNL